MNNILQAQVNSIITAISLEKHYIKSMSGLLNKSEKDIQDELEIIKADVKLQLIESAEKKK
ncbi:MAG: hypothetical protein RL154_1162 [Pseudomonadota bacterium]|jgi:hypothetical protein